MFIFEIFSVFIWQINFSIGAICCSVKPDFSFIVSGLGIVK